MIAQSQTPIITRQPLHRRPWFKRLLVAIIAVLFVIAAVIIVIILWWWNSPEKALLDVANYAVKTPGSYHVTAKDTDLTMTVRDQEYAMSGTLQGIQLQAVVSGGTLYLKSPDPNRLYGLFMGSPDQQVPEIIQTIVPTLVNKWIAVNLSNFPLKANGAVTTQCLLQEKESIAHDPNSRREWASVYLANRFLGIQTSSQNATTSYTVSVNKQPRSRFFASLQKTSFYGSLTNCSKETDILRSVGDKLPIATVVTSQSKRILQSMIINPRSKDPVTVTANYANVPTITVPTDTITTDQLLIRYIQSIGGAQSLLQ